MKFKLQIVIITINILILLGLASWTIAANYVISWKSIDEYISLIVPSILFTCLSLLVTTFLLYFYSRVFARKIISRINLDRENTLIYGETGAIYIDDSERVTITTGIISERFGQKFVRQKITSLDSNFINAMNSPTIVQVVKLKDNWYDVIYIPSTKAFILKDVTKIEVLINELEDSKPLVGIIYIDNYKEIIKSIDDNVSLRLANQIKVTIFDWAKSYGIFLKSYADDAFICLAKIKEYKKMLETNFDILEKVKQVAKQNDVDVALSISISYGETTLDNLHASAQDGLALALSRGGDQVVVKEYGQLATFIGGNTESRAVLSKTQIRSFTTDLRAVISKFTNIIIMAHKFADFDAIGSMMAISYLCKELGKNVKFVLNEKTIDDKLKGALAKLPKKYLLENTISPEKVTKWVESQNTIPLLIICDVSDISWVESSELLKVCPTQLVIDHHRSKEGTIQGTKKYVEASASSAVEITTEILEYSNIPRDNLLKEELDIMLAGIITDTNNYKFRTSERTFGASSTLRQWGANTTDVDELLKDTIEEFNLKSKVFATAEQVIPGFLLLFVPNHAPIQKAMLAKIADAALAAKGIEASFVIGNIDGGGIGLSCRSNGKINVMTIAESLGGGGHFTAAASEFFEDATVESVVAKVKNVIMKWSGKDESDLNKRRTRTR